MHSLRVYYRPKKREVLLDLAKGFQIAPLNKYHYSVFSRMRLNKNKLAIIHTIAIKLKENVTMQLVCVLSEWKSQSSKKKNLFFLKIGIFFKNGKKGT